MADLSNTEYQKLRLSIKMENKSRLASEKQSRVAPIYTARNLPASVDWRKKGYVTPVGDQGQCNYPSSTTRNSSTLSLFISSCPCSLT
jgi:hypothetical protein